MALQNMFITEKSLNKNMEMDEMTKKVAEQKQR